MPPEDVRRSILRQWLEKANADIEAAEFLSSGEATFHGIVGFHAQQAAEKYIKAYLTWHQVVFGKTHDIGELLDRVDKCDPGLADVLQDAVVLSKYGVEVRYPADVPELSKADVTEAVELAKAVRNAILRALPAELIQ